MKFELPEKKKNFGTIFYILNVKFKTKIIENIYQMMISYKKTFSKLKILKIN